MNKLDHKKNKLFLEQLAEKYCAENKIKLIEGHGEGNNLEINYQKNDSRENLELTKQHSNDVLDYDYVNAIKKTNEKITEINYVSLSNNRFYNKFKEYQKILRNKYSGITKQAELGYHYFSFLREMCKYIEDIEKNNLLGLGIILKYHACAEKEDVKKIIDDLIK